MPGINFTPQQLKTATPVILPVLALYALKLTAGPAPTFARQIVDDQPAVAPVRLVQPTDASLRCAVWETRQRALPCGPSPFFYPDGEEVIEPDQPVEDAPQPRGKPAVTLGGVMGSGSRAVALINGTLHSVGDDVGGGWAIEAIDVNTQSVTLVHTDGARHKLSSQ